MKTKLAMIFLVAAAVTLAAGALSAAEPLVLDKKVYNPGEKMEIKFTAPSSWDAKAWVGIIPSSVPHGDEAVNDQHDLVYEYLEKRESGTIIFSAPAWPGSYDVRMHDSDASGKETASVTFTVAGDPGKVSISLDKTTFKPGEPIVVNYVGSPLFDASAWIGIIPSNIPHGLEAVNDSHDLTYQRAGKGPGSLTFAAPSNPGAYDFRMHHSDSGGLEVAYVSFTVEGGVGTGTMSLAKDTFAPGEQIVVTFTADPSFESDAWIGIIPSSVPHGDEAVNDQHDLAYEYIEKRTSGTMTFTAPDTPGSYDFRMHNTDKSGVEVASITFTVK